MTGICQPDYRFVSGLLLTYIAMQPLKEAKGRHCDRVGDEDIFLGLLLEGDGLAARVLKKLGVGTEEARAAIQEESTLK